MRAILVDWLVEVSEEYRLQSETLCLAVNYIDRFLSFMSVVRAKLQLVGTAAMFIASWVLEKFNYLWKFLIKISRQKIRGNLSTRDRGIRVHHRRHLHETASVAHGKTLIEGSFLWSLRSIGFILHQFVLGYDEYPGKGSILGKGKKRFATFQRKPLKFSLISSVFLWIVASSRLALPQLHSIPTFLGRNCSRLLQPGDVAMEQENASDFWLWNRRS